MNGIIDAIPKVDVHVHLGNVCGIHVKCGSSKKTNDNLLALLDYNRYLSQFILSPLCPKTYIKKAIARTQANNLEDLESSLKSNAVQQCWLLPIEPYVSSRDLFRIIEKKDQSQLIVLASVNFNVNQTREDILKSIKEQKSLFRCPGIKFHPNIQNVDPSSAQAQFFYEGAEEYGMFILIHGGYTPFLPGTQARLAKVRNFYHILLKYKKLKVIFAHMGQYFCNDPEIIKELRRCENFYVETSGVSSDLIAYALKHFDSDRILFGTDWPFCTHRLATKILNKAIQKHTQSELTRRELLEKILNSNIRNFLKD